MVKLVCCQMETIYKYGSDLWYPGGLTLHWFECTVSQTPPGSPSMNTFHSTRLIQAVEG